MISRYAVARETPSAAQASASGWGSRTVGWILRLMVRFVSLSAGWPGRRGAWLCGGALPGEIGSECGRGWWTDGLQVGQEAQRWAGRPVGIVAACRCSPLVVDVDVDLEAGRPGVSAAGDDEPLNPPAEVVVTVAVPSGAVSADI